MEKQNSREIRAHCSLLTSLHFECARVSLLRICSFGLSCFLTDIWPFVAWYWFLVEWFTVCSETKQTDCRHKALMQMAARMQHLLHTQTNWSTVKATELTESLVCVTPAQRFCASDLSGGTRRLAPLHIIRRTNIQGNFASTLHERGASDNWETWSIMSVTQVA